MKTGPLASDVNGPTVVEIQRQGSTYYGLELADFCGTLTETAKLYANYRPTVLAASPVNVPVDFAGLTVENFGCGDGTSPIPTVTYGTHRLLGFGTYWPEIETSDGVFNWTKMDAAVNGAVAAGKTVMWNACYTPTFHSSAPTTAKKNTIASSGGWPVAPADLAGTQQTWPTPNSAKWARFLTAVVTRYAGKIKRYVMWNEPNARIFPTARISTAPVGNWWDTSDTGTTADFVTPRTSVTGNQNYTQFVRMQSDLYNVVKGIDPAAQVLGPDFFGEANSQSSGGKQTGLVCFTAWLAAGGAAFCDGYSWHAYMDESSNLGNAVTHWAGVDGASKRLNPIFNALESARVAAGAPVKPWYQTETGHEQMNWLPLADQERWIGRQMLIAAARGQAAWTLYAYDSYNPATSQMSMMGLDRKTLYPIAEIYSRWAQRLQGATISAASILNTGHVCATINGVQYIV